MVAEKSLKPASELQSLVMDELRENPACDAIIGVTVRRLDHPSSETNWDYADVIGDGASVPPDAKRALVAAVHKVRQRFNLLTDD